MISCRRASLAFQRHIEPIRKTTPLSIDTTLDSIIESKRVYFRRKQKQEPNERRNLEVFRRQYEERDRERMESENYGLGRGWHTRNALRSFSAITPITFEQWERSKFCGTMWPRKRIRGIVARKGRRRDVVCEVPYVRDA
jgi:hypothetical protein